MTHDEGRPKRSRFELQMSFVEGSHGQDLIDAGSADMVLRLTGELLKEVQRIPANSLAQIPGSEGRQPLARVSRGGLLAEKADRRVTDDRNRVAM